MEGFRQLPLAEACEIKPPKKEASQRLEESELVSFVPMAQLGVRKPRIGLTENRTLKEVLRSYTYFAEGDVLLAKITPCFENGKLGIATGLTNGVGFGSSEFVVLRPRPSLLAKYLFHYLSQDTFLAAGRQVMKGAVGHKRVPKEFIAETVIPLPPLPEQERIVAILDEAFEAIDTAIANTEKNLSNSEELFQSILDQQFNDPDSDESECERTLLKKISTRINYGHTASASYERNDTKFLRITDIQDGSVVWEDVPGCECNENEKEKYLLEDGDIVFARTGATTGKSYLVKDCPKNTVFASYLIRVKPSADIDSSYLAYFFQSSDYWDQIQEKSSGSAQPGVNATKLKELRIPFTSATNQERIVTVLDEASESVQALGDGLTVKLAGLEELKQSVLEKAFSGELTDSVLEEAGV
jgi:type I restriction enzyme, S subunit